MNSLEDIKARAITAKEKLAAAEREVNRYDAIVNAMSSGGGCYTVDDIRVIIDFALNEVRDDIDRVSKGVVTTEDFITLGYCDDEEYVSGNKRMRERMDELTEIGNQLIGMLDALDFLVDLGYMSEA